MGKGDWPFTVLYYSVISYELGKERGREGGDGERVFGEPPCRSGSDQHKAILWTRVDECTAVVKDIQWILEYPLPNTKLFLVHLYLTTSKLV